MGRESMSQEKEDLEDFYMDQIKMMQESME